MLSPPNEQKKFQDFWQVTQADLLRQMVKGVQKTQLIARLVQPACD
jgi:hypothetical protein